MTDPRLQHLIDLLESVTPPVTELDPPLIMIDGDGLVCWNGPLDTDGEYYKLDPDERNADVWMSLEFEGL